MKVVDANVLLYAMDETTRHHRAAKGWLDPALAGGSVVGLAWMALIAFVRISTNARIFTSPLSSDEAYDTIDAWLTQPGAAVIEPTARHATLLRELSSEVGTAGNPTNDLHLAALSVEHHGSVVSFDRDFQRFTRVRWELPTPH